MYVDPYYRVGFLKSSQIGCFLKTCICLCVTGIATSNIVPYEPYEPKYVSPERSYFAETCTLVTFYAHDLWLGDIREHLDVCDDLPWYIVIIR